MYSSRHANNNIMNNKKENYIQYIQKLNRKLKISHNTWKKDVVCKQTCKQERKEQGRTSLSVSRER